MKKHPYSYVKHLSHYDLIADYHSHLKSLDKYRKIVEDFEKGMKELRAEVERRHIDTDHFNCKHCFFYDPMLNKCKKTDKHVINPDNPCYRWSYKQLFKDEKP